MGLTRRAPADSVLIHAEAGGQTKCDNVKCARVAKKRWELVIRDLDNMETWKKSDIAFDGKIIRVRTGTVSLDDGTEAYREVVEHPGGVCVLPFLNDTFVFVRQYRIALGKPILEAPAGKLETGELPKACARKELREETGYTADQLISLGAVYSSVGFCTETIHLFLAAGLTFVGCQLEPEERIESVAIGREDAHSMMMNNVFSDAKTAVVVQRALSWLDR